MRERSKQHIGDGHTENVIAKELKTLIAANPIAGASRNCRDMGQREIKERFIKEVIPDTLLKDRRSLLTPLPRTLP